MALFTVREFLTKLAVEDLEGDYERCGEQIVAVALVFYGLTPACLRYGKTREQMMNTMRMASYAYRAAKDAVFKFEGLAEKL